MIVIYPPYEGLPIVTDGFGRRGMPIQYILSAASNGIDFTSCSVTVILNAGDVIRIQNRDGGDYYSGLFPDGVKLIMTKVHK